MENCSVSLLFSLGEKCGRAPVPRTRSHDGMTVPSPRRARCLPPSCRCQSRIPAVPRPASPSSRLRGCCAAAPPLSARGRRCYKRGASKTYNSALSETAGIPDHSQGSLGYFYLFSNVFRDDLLSMVLALCTRRRRQTGDRNF